MAINVSNNIGGTNTMSGYIPAGTTYTVKTDGTGDFSKLCPELRNIVAEIRLIIEELR